MKPDFQLFFIILIILVILISLSYSDTCVNFIKAIGGFAENKTLPKQINVKVLSWNIGINQNTPDQWKHIIQSWPELINKDYDILFLALQEDYNENSKYGQLGQTICDYLYDFNCYKYTVDGPPFNQLSKKQMPFSVKAFVFTKKILGIPKINKQQTCFQSKLSICTKATAGISVEFPNHNFIFMSSHLPFKPSSTDLGYSKRVQAMEQSVKWVFNKLRNNKPYTAFWAGDMNFRRDAATDKLSTVPDQLDYMIKYNPLGFVEYDRNFPPTCKLFESSKKQNIASCRKYSTNPLNKESIISNPPSCYNMDTHSGKRTPSHCDRILYRSSYRLPQINKYTSWTDNNAINNSDHNAIVLSATIMT